MRAVLAVVPLAAAACTSASGSGASKVPPVEVISCFDLPRDDPRSHNLSGLAWDGDQRRLYAISDRDKQLTVLSPRPGFLGFDLLPPIALHIDVKQWDGEAVALAGDRFLIVANEQSPGFVYSVDRTGRRALRVEVPPFIGMRPNLGLEAIGYLAAPESRYVFLANEQAMEGDGPISTPSHGTIVRIVRHSLDGKGDLEMTYLTDPVFAEGDPGDNGVSDLAVLSPTRLLLLERGWVKGKGNSAKVFAVDFTVAASKRPVVDLAQVDDARCSWPRSPQCRRILENYEGMALGPTLGDGRRLLFLVADDNSDAGQIPRLVTLALVAALLEQI